MNRNIAVRNQIRHIDGVTFGPGLPARLGLLIGVTPGFTTPPQELEKALTCGKLGVSTVTDLSTDGSGVLRRMLLDSFGGAVGTLPVYEIYREFRDGVDLKTALFSTLERHASEGVDFFSVHASLTPDLAEKAIATSAARAIPITSRGGAMMADILMRSREDNPFLRHWPEVLALCSDYSITLSMVGSLRPGSTADSLEPCHLEELSLQSVLVREADHRGVNTMVELLNHVPLCDIGEYIRIARDLFGSSVIGALGPSPTDIAVGMDDVAGAIGAASAVVAGCNWVNCITSAEHVSLPKIEQTVQAVRYFRLALHIAELSIHRGHEQDRALSAARAANDWDAMARLSIFPEHAAAAISGAYSAGAPCTMCGKECPLVRVRAIRPAMLALPSGF